MTDNSKITIKLETITPDIAWKWIGSNSNNRDIKQMNVRKLVKEIQEDQWESKRPDHML